MTAHVLVTGAAGLIGSAVIRHLDGVRITALDLRRRTDLRVHRWIEGNVEDPATVRDAMRGVDAVVHLAGRTSPDAGTRNEVFVGNVAGAYTVLGEAGDAGVRNICMASSINALGLRFGSHPVETPVLPLDTDTPSRATDPYSLSKLLSEQVAEAMVRQYGYTVVALRFPFVCGDPDPALADARLRGLGRYGRAHPLSGKPDFWAYLDMRDAARASVAALSPKTEGFAALFVAAPTTNMDVPTEELLAEHYPSARRSRRFHGHEVPIDLRPAEDLLGFTARHVIPTDGT